MLKKLFRFVFDPEYRFLIRGYYGGYRNMPDDVYLKRKFKIIMKKELDLDNPQTFNEKLQWLKLYNRKPIYTQMVDKLGAKDYVAERIGSDYIIPTLGVWDSFDDIDFDSLPDRFVLKCTHDSGGLVICRDKAAFNKKAAKKKINKSLKKNYYYSGREWPYKDVKPRIIAEAYMEDNKLAEGLTDYKFYCFGGEPKFLYVSAGMEDHATASISFVTLDWTFAPYERSDYKPLSELPQKPSCFEEMLEICKKLAKNIPFLRVDLYEINGKIYFSELTFHPCSGFMPFANAEHDLEIGNLLELPQ